MKKAMIFCAILAMGVLNSGCLGLEKTPAFISDVKIKINERGYQKQSLLSLPEGPWSVNELGYGYIRSDGGFALKADVTGNEDMEVLRSVTGRKGIIGAATSLQVWDAKGNLMNQIQPAGYLSFFRTANVDEDPKQEIILYSYPNKKRGGAIEIVKADGAVLYRWDNHFQGYFEVIDWKESPHILSIEENAFVIRTLSGGQATQLDAPYADYFRWITGKRLENGVLIILVSGSGYRPYHMVSVYNAENKLIFQEVASGHARALLASPQYPNKFLVAHGNDYFSYTPTASR